MYYNPLLKKPINDQKLKIALVDDHTLLRDALINTIDGFNHCEVILKASHGLEFIKQLEQIQRAPVPEFPDIVILDLNMPKMDGYETARWLSKHFPDMRILVLSMFDSEVTLIRLLQLGVKGFLKKDTHPKELQYAIHSLIEEGYYYPQTVSGKLANVFHNPTRGFFTQPLVLTDAEIRFLKFTSTEMTYKEIAKEMFISPRTVDNYRDQLFEKLQVKSRVGLAIYALKNGIVNF